MSPDELRILLLDRLAAQANLQVWDGEPGTGEARGYRAGERDVAIDPDGRAHMYAALYLGPGSRSLDDERITGVGGTRGVTFQVTAAGGDPRRCLRAAEKVAVALEGYRVPHGGRIRLDVDPGPPRIDRDPKPSRHFLPLIGRTSI